MAAAAERPRTLMASSYSDGKIGPLRQRIIDSVEYGDVTLICVHKIVTVVVGHYKQLSTQRPGSPKNTTQQHDVSVQSTLDRRPMYYSQKQKWTRRVRMQTQ